MGLTAKQTQQSMPIISSTPCISIPTGPYLSMLNREIAETSEDVEEFEIVKIDQRKGYNINAII
jgi:hypothetical protein